MFERFEKQVQFHTGTTQAHTGDRAGVFQGHAPSDEDRSRMMQRILNGEAVYAVEPEQVPDHAPLAAVLRY